MINQEVILEMLNNISNIEEIKIEDSVIYNEYSVIVLYKNNSDILVCENSDEANFLFNYLTDKLNQYKTANKEDESLEK